MHLHPYESERFWSEFCPYGLQSSVAIVRLVAPQTLDLMLESALRVGFALPKPSLDRSHAHNSANIALSLIRGGMYRVHSFMCCNLPEYGMSTCTGTKITCFRVLSDFPVNLCLDDGGIRTHLERQ